MKKIRETVYAILLVCLLLLLLSACRAEKKLTGGVLKEMRNHYPYCHTANASIATLPEEYWAKGGDVFAVVELTEDRKETTRTEYPNPSVDPYLTTEVTTYYFPAKVLEILDIRDGCSLTEQEITLSFPGLLYDPNIAFEKGQRLVIIGAMDKSSGKVLLGIGPIMSFYLIDEEYVLSLSSDAQMDQFSGWKLEALEKEMLRITEAGGWHQLDSTLGK